MSIASVKYLSPSVPGHKSMMQSAVALKAPFTAEPALDVARQLFSAETFEPVARSDAPPTVATPDGSAAGPIAWVEPEESLWLLSLRNFGLTLMTFGVYHFWGRAEARRRTTNSVRVNGQPLDHTGTGFEAFVSFAIGALICISLTSLFVSMMKQSSGGIEGVREIRWQRLSISLPLLFLLGSTIYRKRQHILRRTWLSGQRFDLSGYAWGYAWRHFWSAFLVPLTLGWAAPWRASRLEAVKIRDMHFGGTRFRSEADLKPLYKAFALLWFGGGFLYFATLIVLSLNIGPQLMAAIQGLTLQPLSDAEIVRRGLTIFLLGCAPLITFALIYRKAWIEHQLSSVAFDGGRLRMHLPLTGYLWLVISNAALKIGSLGALAPVAEARSMRYMIGHIHVEGQLDLQPARVGV